MKETILALVLTLLSAQGAQSVATVATPGSYAHGFATAVVVTTEGRQATFTNLDVAAHDVVASEHFRPDGSKAWCERYASGGCPLFWTGLVRGGESAPVDGSEDAAPGRYPFHCTIHASMRGTLIVV